MGDETPPELVGVGRVLGLVGGEEEEALGVRVVRALSGQVQVLLHFRWVREESTEERSPGVASEELVEGPLAYVPTQRLRPGKQLAEFVEAVALGVTNHNVFKVNFLLSWPEPSEEGGEATFLGR